MEFQEGPLRAVLTTKGRKTGRDHSVELRAVFYNGRLYFSRRNASSDWLKNAMTNPQVKVAAGGSAFTGTAALVTDEGLAKKISSLKYSDTRADEARVVLQVTPDG